MDLKQLKYFTTVVEEKTVTAAAKKLNMTQPPLTMQLHMLESELGVKLFRREGRLLHLTEAGEKMYTRSLEILGLLTNTAEEMKLFKSGVAGTLKIGIISSVQGTFFNELIKKYALKYPDVIILISEGNTYELLEKIKNREIDIAIIRTPFSASDLNIKYLKTEKMFAVGEKKFFKNIKQSNNGFYNIDFSHLSKLPLIIYRRWQKVLESAFEANGITPNFKCINDDARMTLSLTLEKIGVGIMHPSALPKNLPENFIKCEIDSSLLTSKIALVTKSKTFIPETSELFWNIIAK